MIDNYIQIYGHLTRDPEYHEPHDDKKQFVNFTVAVNRWNSEKADFFDCVAFGKAADIISTHYRKGTACSIAGSMQCDPYEAKDGSKRYPWRLYVEEFKIRSKKKDNEPGEQFNGFETFDVDVPF